MFAKILKSASSQQLKLTVFSPKKAKISHPQNNVLALQPRPYTMMCFVNTLCYAYTKRSGGCHKFTVYNCNIGLESASV